MDGGDRQAPTSTSAPPHLNQTHPASGALFLSQLWWLHCDTRIGRILLATLRRHHIIPVPAAFSSRRSTRCGCSSLSSKPRDLTSTNSRRSLFITSRRLPRNRPCRNLAKSQLDARTNATRAPSLAAVGCPSRGEVKGKQRQANLQPPPRARQLQLLVRSPPKPPNWSPSESAPPPGQSSWTCKLRPCCWGARRA